MIRFILCVLMLVAMGSVVRADDCNDGCPVGNYNVGDGTCCPYGKTGSGGMCYSHVDSNCGEGQWSAGTMSNGRVKCCPFGYKDGGGDDCTTDCHDH